MSGNDDKEKLDPIGAILDDVSEDAPDPFEELRKGSAAPPPARDPLMDSGERLVADLVKTSDERAAVRPTRPPEKKAPAPEPARKPKPLQSSLPPSTGGFDRQKVEKLTIVGCVAGLVWFLVTLWLRPPVEEGPTFRSRAEAMVAALEKSLEKPDAEVEAALDGVAVPPDPEGIPAALDSASLPGRQEWNEAMRAPREFTAAEEAVRARFEAVAERLAGWNRKLVTRGLAPAWVHADDPLGSESRIGTRIPHHERKLGELSGSPDGAGAFLSALRDCTRSISRRTTGKVLNLALDRSEKLGWSLGLAPRVSLLGTPDAPAGDVSPQALTTALVHLLRAQEAADRKTDDHESLLAAARLVISGFPTPGDPFGAAWARVASRLYLLAGHPRTAVEVVASFCEKSRRSGGAVPLGTAALRGLLRAFGKEAPPRLEKLWREYHGGSPPGEPGWWEKLPPRRRTPNGLMGLVPSARRIQGADKGGGALTERERKRRYARFRRRRRSS